MGFFQGEWLPAECSRKDGWRHIVMRWLPGTLARFFGSKLIIREFVCAPPNQEDEWYEIEGKTLKPAYDFYTPQFQDLDDVWYKNESEIRERERSKNVTDKWNGVRAQA